MKYLYLDNIRGFSDTYIPLKDVNFLVGENSTGKTTVLSILNLLDSPEFWFEPQFNTHEIYFGDFNDIITISDNKKITEINFKIGVIEYLDQVNGEKQKSINIFLLVFAEDDGLPVIQQYHRLNHQTEINILFGQDEIKYKLSKLSKKTVDSRTFIRDKFKSWTNVIVDQKNYQVIDKKELPVSRKRGLVFIPVLLDRLSQNMALDETVEAVELTPFTPNLTWLAPIRSKPRRTYDGYKVEFSPEGEHTPHLIRQILKSKQGVKDAIMQAVQSFGTNSNLFENIEVKNFGDASAPFELRVVLDGKSLRISDVGYGISQVLPVLVDILARSEESWFAIQQLEVHLHPKAQAALGDMFFNLAVGENKKFLIETHSDYTIDRFRLNYQKRDEEINTTAQVLFFERTAQGNQVHPIAIEQNGAYAQDQPPAFREFFIKEELALLGL